LVKPIQLLLAVAALVVRRRQITQEQTAQILSLVRLERLGEVVVRHYLRLLLEAVDLAEVGAMLHKMLVAQETLHFVVLLKEMLVAMGPLLQITVVVVAVEQVVRVQMALELLAGMGV
jgi:hypothetical protein